jgi:hypothetical protein
MCTACPFNQHCPVTGSNDLTRCRFYHTRHCIDLCRDQQGESWVRRRTPPQGAYGGDGKYGHTLDLHVGVVPERLTP